MHRSPLVIICYVKITPKEWKSQIILGFTFSLVMNPCRFDGRHGLFPRKKPNATETHSCMCASDTLHRMLTCPQSLEVCLACNWPKEAAKGAVSQNRTCSASCHTTAPALGPVKCTLPPFYISTWHLTAALHILALCGGEKFCTNFSSISFSSSSSITQSQLPNRGRKG